MHLTRRGFAAVLLSLLAILFLQAAATLLLERNGFSDDHARNLPRLVGLPVLFAITWHILKWHGVRPARIFATSSLTIRLAATAIAIGFLLRASFWAMITARGAFGWLPIAAASTPRELDVSWSCPAFDILVVSLLVWWFLVPLTEEFVHRATIQSALENHGKALAILASTTIFTLAHEPPTYLSVFMIGAVLGVLYWNTGCIWVPIIVHATYDGLIPFDTLCLKLAWNPAATDIPVWSTGLSASLILGACWCGILWILPRQRAGATSHQPVAERLSEPD